MLHAGTLMGALSKQQICSVIKVMNLTYYTFYYLVHLHNTLSAPAGPAVTFAFNVISRDPIVVETLTD